MKESKFCAVGEQYLGGYLERRLNPPEEREYIAHLEHCQLCRQEWELWTRLGGIGPLESPPAVSPRFESNFAEMLDREVQQELRYSKAGATAQQPVAGTKRPFAWGKPGLWVAAAALVVAGFLAGILTAGSGWSGSGWGGSGQPKSEVAELRQEVRMMRSLVAVSLMQQQSTAERLRGVSYSSGLEQPDDAVVAALLRTLRADTSVDVRMAAADALRRYRGQAQVRQSMAEALELESSPLVQIMLIDALVEAREGKAAPALRVLMAEEGLDPTVRQRAVRALQEIQSPPLSGAGEYK